MTTEQMWANAALLDAAEREAAGDRPAFRAKKHVPDVPECMAMLRLILPRRVELAADHYGLDRAMAHARWDAFMESKRYLDVCNLGSTKLFGDSLEAAIPSVILEDDTGTVDYAGAL